MLCLVKRITETKPNSHRQLLCQEAYLQSMEVEAGIKVLNIPRMRGQHGDVAINTGIITMLTPNGQQIQTL